jgi:hypothetical protein
MIAHSTLCVTIQRESLPGVICNMSSQQQPSTYGEHILGERNAACSDTLLPLRSSSVPTGVNSPPVSMLGYPLLECRQQLDFGDNSSRVSPVEHKALFGLAWSENEGNSSSGCWS